MAKTLVSSSAPTHDEIAAQAYEIYLREGSVPGRDLDHWLQAEEELRSGKGNGDRELAVAQSSAAMAESAKGLGVAAEQNQSAARATNGRRSRR